MTDFLYVYGTLRPGGPETVKIKGRIYNMGWYPGLKLGGEDEVVCEKLPVTAWEGFDRYEGYMPDDPEHSLYIRKPFLDGYIYEINGPVDEENLIESGDWLQFRKEREGSHVRRFA